MAKEKRDTTGFGPRLKALRVIAGLTQEQLGELVGMRYQNVARLERGEQTPGWDTVIKFAEALHCEPNDFLEDDTDPPATGGDAGAGRRPPRPRGK